MTALDKLIEVIEAGTVYATMGHTMMCRKAFPPRWEGDHGKDSRAQLCVNAWNKSSLDAALALHEALLPGWRARLDIGRRNRCWVISPDNRKLDAYATTPARAWLLAILRAYRSVQA